MPLIEHFFSTVYRRFCLAGTRVDQALIADNNMGSLKRCKKGNAVYTQSKFDWQERTKSGDMPDKEITSVRAN